MSKGTNIRKAASLSEKLMESLLLVALAGDILYLYFAGGWQEPNLAILIMELIALWTIIVIGIFKFWLGIKEAAHDQGS